MDSVAPFEEEVVVESVAPVVKVVVQEVVVESVATVVNVVAGASLLKWPSLLWLWLWNP